MRPKNRVWDFSRNGRDLSLENRRRRPEQCGKSRPTPTIFTSGIPQWPSRDPIGEEGGVNLYGFGPNSPIGGVDNLGGTWFGTAAKWLGAGALVVGVVAAVVGAPGLATGLAIVMGISAIMWGTAAIIDQLLDPDDGKWDNIWKPRPKRPEPLACCECSDGSVSYYPDTESCPCM